jgi:ATP-dependent RNA helicase MSS116
VLQQGNGLDLLIATPGRLKDLLQNYDGIKASLSQMVALVLDEADRLLDMGFKPDLDAIFAMLPGPDKRQTQLFSATFPANVQEMTNRTLKRDHVVVNTVGDEDDQTHKHVIQESVIVPLAAQNEALYELIAMHKESCPHYKIIVFFTTARVASFSSRLFNAADCQTLELHSRLSQSKRTKTSETFRDGKKMVLFSSDVSARGLDFPGVTLIIQLGLTAPDQYVHRLGRTARAGNEGHGIIILAPFERRFLGQLSQMPIQQLVPKQGSVLSALVAGQTPSYPASARKGAFAHPVQYALSMVEGNGNHNSEDSLKSEAESAYRAWMGFMNSNLRICGWDKVQLVATANEYAGFIGLAEIPSIEAKTIGKMGLRGTPGLRIAPNEQRQGGGQGGNGGGRGGRGGGQGGNGGGRGGRGGGQARPSSARY